ncbi:Trk system potassium transporter TrkA [Membranicola marinus]|uniref:Trk system potassium uptake protein TrkA n=1 Tax=Membranihabitans marinus TaxID=1227546 RepID=A0A953HWU9_9BACT|nr:Trk system potassium transporter TrkA [Membranihabitans marinus]MBY5957227.1 Trk system potassium transporter TrkA [Membranihabitans marinus]
MKIILAGAGEVGRHLAKLLSFENHEIILIDIEQETLDNAFNQLDILPVKGDAAARSVLHQAEIGKADLYMAVTTSEHTNLVSAILAKKMGAKQTIARVENPEFLEKDQIDVFKELGVDTIISPNYLVAKEITRLLKQTALTDIFEFENGKLSVIGLTVRYNSKIANKNILEIEKMTTDFPFRPIAILRGNTTIRPRGTTIVRPRDHIYLMSRREEISKATTFAGKMNKTVKSVMILGGGEITRLTARMIEKIYNVTIVEEDKESCKILLENLSNSLVIKGDPTNFNVLREEGLEEMDALICLMPSSEANIIMSLMAEELKAIKTIALVDNADYIRLSQNIGVDTLLNTKLIAANNIFRFVRKGEIEAITSLHGVDAEIIEFTVTKNNKMVRKPLYKLHFPDKALIAGVIREEESIIPDGNFQLQIDDKVIVFAEPEAISLVEKMFR